MIINSIPLLVKIDFTLPPEDLVVELINHDNGTDFKSKQLIFGIPELLSKGRHNSSVKVSASEKGYFSGSTILKYNRVDIKAVTFNKSTEFELTTQKTIAEIIPLINARYSLRLTSADYIDGPLPTISPITNNDVSFDLVAAPTSLVFIGKMILKVQLGDLIQLNTIIKSYVLHGLVYSKPVPPLPQLIDIGYINEIDLGSLFYSKPALSSLIDY